jgi:hypothetical protein
MLGEPIQSTPPSPSLSPRMEGVQDDIFAFPSGWNLTPHPTSPIIVDLSTLYRNTCKTLYAVRLLQLLVLRRWTVPYQKRSALLSLFLWFRRLYALPNLAEGRCDNAVRNDTSPRWDAWFTLRTFRDRHGLCPRILQGKVALCKSGSFFFSATRATPVGN